MRLNRYLAQAVGVSRRAADELIKAGRVRISDRVGVLGDAVTTETVSLDGQIVAPQPLVYLALNKPVGYVTSRARQGNSPTIYDLLPAEYHHLKPVGRLDKDTAGLLVLTNDGGVAQRLTHPSFGKTKRYRVVTRPAFKAADTTRLEAGVKLADGVSQLTVEQTTPLVVALTEGRNRQIRRTFGALGYQVVELERLSFGQLELGNLRPEQTKLITPEDL